MKKFRWLFGLILLTTICPSIHGQDPTAPPSIVGAEGNGTGFYDANTGLVSQEIYRAADLPGLQAGDVITGFRLRVEGNLASYPTDFISWPRFDVTMGVPASTLSTTFADNFQGTPKQVREGSIFFQPGDFPGGAAPNGFGVLIEFDSPYVYPGGDLIMEVRSEHGSEQLIIDTTSDTNGVSLFDQFAGAGGGDADATESNTGILGFNWAIQFEIQDHVLPPSIVDAEGNDTGFFDPNFGLVSQQILDVSDLNLQFGDVIRGFQLRQDSGGADFGNAFWPRF